ncbi:MAG: low molecular weight phosphotyrosine protein phosphatase [Bacteroidetes bacterium]|nr:low molecular weight phosphotyrosine protein phosphatase [Bacteroidota bacterium]MBL6942910.1 low molecular weight phosphotyrosine protein phosphatase [Bacteroidales bacterium]
MNILFVCNENICRSPIAEALLKKKFEENNIEGVVDSAGFEPTTINDSPNPQAVEAAKKHNLDLKGNSRIFVKKDFDRFDKIYVMDTLNYREVKYLTRNKADETKVDYLMNVIEPGKNQTVPNPIHSGIIDIDSVIKILDNITDVIVNNIKSSKSDI